MSTSDGESHDSSFVQNDIRDVFVKWNEAVQQHSNGKYSEALGTYAEMHELSARVLYNMAMAHINLYDNSSAKKCLTVAVEKDELLAIAFYQRGLLHLKSKNYGDAIDDLESTRALLRGNTYINYRPLGLFGRLHIFQILFNLSLAYLHADDENEAGILLNEAIHDADHAQRKHISESVRLIKENRVHEIKPLLFTTEKVFAPPKAITYNLESPASWKGSTVVFSADREASFGTWDAMKTANESRISTSLRSNKKKTFRKIKSLNDMKVSMVNSDFYYRRRSDSQMETIRENRHLFRNSSILNRRRSSRKKQLIREHSITLPEDSIIEMIEPPDYEEIALETTIQWHDDVVDVPTEHESGALVNDCETISQPDGTKIRTSSSKATSRCNVKPPSNQQHDEFDSNTNDTDRNTTHVYRKSFSAGMVENAMSEPKEVFTRSSKSTSDLEKNRRKSLLPLEDTKAHRTPRNIFTQCFSRRKSNTQNVDNPYPTVLMSGCKAIAEMFSDGFVPVPNTTTSPSGNVPNTASINNMHQSQYNSSVDSDKRKTLNNLTANVNKRPAKTLGTVFGDKSSVVKYALTLACDNLTAVATPTIDHEDIKRQTEKPRRIANTSAVNEEGRIRYFKNKRAPPPPLATLGANLAAAQGMFAALAQLNLENEPKKGDTNNNNKRPDHNNNGDYIDKEAVSQGQMVDGNDNSGIKSGTMKSLGYNDNKLAIFEPSDMMNSTYCELQPHENSDVYNPASDSQVDIDDQGTCMTTCTDNSITTHEDESACIQCTHTETNKPDETVIYANVETCRKTFVGSKKFRASKSSTRAKVSIKVRKGSYRNNCFSFHRAKTPPPSYPPPVLKPESRKRPTSTRRKSRRVSGKKKGTAETTDSFTLGNAMLAPLAMLGGAGSVPVKEQRPSLTSISECPREKEARKQSEEDIEHLDTIELVEDGAHVFESAFTENTPSTGGNFFNGDSDTLQIGKDLQLGNMDAGGKLDSSPETRNKADARALLYAFVKSNTSIQHEFDNFVKQSYCGSLGTSIFDDGLYLCMDGVHNAKCTGGCLYDQRGDN